MFWHYYHIVRGILNQLGYLLLIAVCPSESVQCIGHCVFEIVAPAILKTEGIALFESLQLSEVLLR